MKRKLKIYWICEEISKTHRERALAISERGFELHFFQTHQDLIARVKEERVSIVMVDDRIPTDKAKALIDVMLMTPELQGVRFILSVISGNQAIADHAAASAFRDLIPMALSDKTWINRVVYSSSRQPLKWPLDHPRISIPSLAKIAIPGRIVWISPQRVLIEARMRPEPETSLAFTGAFAQAIGAKSISLTVVEHRHSGLVYRFSDAMLCSWAVSEETYEKAQSVLADMKDHCLGPRCRIFLASSSPSVRQTLAKIFDPNRFDLNFALQKQSIVDEPKYFSPDVIFIDSAFFGPEQINFIKQAMANIGNDVPIYVLGKSIERVELQARFPGKNFTVLGGIQARLSDLVYQKYLDSVTKDRQSADQDAIHLSPNHPFATLKVQMSARTHVLSRGGMSFGVSSSLGLHGVCQVESPLFTKVLGRSPYVKIHAAVAHAETEDHHSRVYESFYSNLSAKERYDLGVGLADYIAQKFVEADAAQLAPLAKVAGDSLALPTSRVSQPPPQQQANLALVATSAESPPSNPTENLYQLKMMFCTRVFK